MTLIVRAIALILLVAIMILLLGPASQIELNGQYLHQDKAAHFLAFGLLLWTFGVLIPTWSRIGLAGLAILVGGGVEIVQGATGRDAEWLDFAADTAGTLTALAIWTLWRRFQPRRARPAKHG